MASMAFNPKKVVLPLTSSVAMKEVCHHWYSISNSPSERGVTFVSASHPKGGVASLYVWLPFLMTCPLAVELWVTIYP